MSIQDVAILTAALVNLVFSATVYLHSRRALLETVFAIFAFTVCLWSVATFLMTSAAVPFEIFKVGAFAHYISGNLVFWLLFWFAAYYPFGTRTSKALLFALSAVNAAILILIVSTEFLFRNFVNTADLAQRITFDMQGYLILSVVVISMFALSQLFLLMKYRRAKERDRTQIGYIIVATSITGSLGLLSNLILPGLGNFSYFYLGPILTTPLFVGVLLYAIVKYQLFNLRVIGAEIFTVLLIVALTVDLFLANGIAEIATRSFILFVVALFGYFLIKSVYREIHAREEIERLDRVRAEFVSIASHQLRTPLTIIKGYISMIREGSYDHVGEKTLNVLNTVYLSTERLIQLVNDLLDLSRMKAGRLQYNFASFDFNEFVDSIVGEFALPAESKGVGIVWGKKNKPVVVWGDENKLRQVVFNLIDNALKYTDKGTIEINLEDKGEAIELTVKDSGIGMSKETIDTLFQKFSRGASMRKVDSEGTGLGLYVARRIVNDHEGEIWAESTGEGKGSTFHVKLLTRNRRSQGALRKDIPWAEAA